MARRSQDWNEGLAIVATEFLHRHYALDLIAGVLLALVAPRVASVACSMRAC